MQWYHVNLMPGFWLIYLRYLLIPDHGIMGTPMPNKFSYLQPRPDGKYTTYDHAQMANTWWLVSWDLMRCETNRRRVSDNNNISQLLRDAFSVSQQPPIWEPPSHYSMIYTTTSLTKILSLSIATAKEVFWPDWTGRGVASSVQLRLPRPWVQKQHDHYG